MNRHDYFEQIDAWPRQSRTYLSTYIVGFILSLSLSLTAYFVAVQQVWAHTTLVAILLLLGGVQFFVQLFYFLHLRYEAAMRERLFILGYALLMVLILGLGSVWIMNNLNNHMMSDKTQVQHYMNSEQGM